MERIPAKFKVGDRVQITRHVHPFQDWMMPPSFDVEEGSVGTILYVIDYYNYAPDYDIELDNGESDVISEPYLALLEEES